MSQIKFPVDGAQLRIMPISGELNEVKEFERRPDGSSFRTDRTALMPDGRPAFELREAKVAAGAQVYGIARVITASRELPASSDEFAAIFNGSGTATVTIRGTREPYGMSVIVEVADIVAPGAKRTTGE